MQTNKPVIQNSRVTINREKEYVDNRLEEYNTTESAIAKVILHKDLGKLTDIERVQYNTALCRVLGLEPLTNPIDYLSAKGGKLVPYINATGIAQLRRIHGVSTQITRRELDKEKNYTVTAIAKDSTGRQEESVAIIFLGTTHGQSKADLMMKCCTKAKRRATLALIGLPTADGENIKKSSVYDPPPDVVLDDIEF